MTGARLLLDVSGPLHIPYFAMASEKDRAKEATLDPSTVLPRMIGGNRARKLLQEFGDRFRIVEQRMVSNGRSAVYAIWAEFAEEGDANTFASSGRPLGLDVLERRASHEHRSMSENLEQELAKGHYNLARLRAFDRQSRAEKYIRLSAELDKLAARLVALKVVRENLASEN